MIPEFIRQLKQDLGYSTWKEQFYSYVGSRDRIQNPLHFYLVYDIDDKEYMIKSELTATFNQIALLHARMPGKNEKTAELLIEDYKY